jgi:hypothetical protein
MAQKKLENLRMASNWTTYLASAEGVLRGAGWWDGETFKLMGMTGMAFHFIMERLSCPSSVTVYEWTHEHMAMMDRIGIHSEAYESFVTMHTFPQMQQAAIARIKASIDRSVGVVVWAPTPVPEFGIITGYDDEDGVFSIEHGMPGEYGPLLYTNLGKSEVSILFYQVFLGKVDVKPAAIYRESLQFGVREWNKTQHYEPNYASGRLAYDNLIGTLQRKDYNPFGLAYNLQVYGSAKADLARYLTFVTGEEREFKPVEKAAALYQQVAERYAKVMQLVPFTPLGQQSGTIPVEEVLDLLRPCKDLEEQAMHVIEKVVPA